MNDSTHSCLSISKLSVECIPAGQSLPVNNQDIRSIQFTTIYVGNLDIEKTDHWTINENKELLDIQVGI